MLYQLAMRRVFILVLAPSVVRWQSPVQPEVLELESTFIDQNNPKRQTADPHWGSPKLDLSGLVYGGLPGVGPWPDSRF
jgi:hypothetical protein